MMMTLGIAAMRISFTSKQDWGGVGGGDEGFPLPVKSDEVFFWRKDES